MDILRSVYGIDDNRSFSMSDFNWCHGPKCHTKQTQDRVRGVKGSKVLRTRKINTRGRQELYWYDYFCSQNCYDNFANEYIQQIIAIAPRTEALETPIHDPIKQRASNSWHSWTETKIEVDETRQID